MPMAKPEPKQKPMPSGTSVRLRALLAALLLSLTAAACGVPGLDAGEDRPVSVLGAWTGDQERAFRKLLDKAGVAYTYQGTAAQREVLLSQVQSGNPPDIALLPSPGELADYARDGQLESLEGLYDPEEYGGKGPWQPAASGAPGNFWVPVKADVKSIAWHRAGSPRPDGTTVGQWCLGMRDDGASGWPGSDWIEDIVLQRFGTQVYEQWAGGVLSWRDPRIAEAWRLWGGLLAQDRAAAKRALLTDHRGAAGSDGLLFGGGPRGSRSCALEHQGTFAPFFYHERASDARFVSSRALLPGGPYMYAGPERSEVSADFAALFKVSGGDSADRRKLLSFLASEAGQREWAGELPYFSANSAVRTGGERQDTESEKIAQRLTDPRSERCLDASDVMPPAVRDAFAEGILRFLSSPGSDPTPRLKAIQSVQQAERAKLTKNAQLSPHAPWMTGICT